MEKLISARGPLASPSSTSHTQSLGLASPRPTAAVAEEVEE